MISRPNDILRLGSCRKEKQVVGCVGGKIETKQSSKNSFRTVASQLHMFLTGMFLGV